MQESALFSLKHYLIFYLSVLFFIKNIETGPNPDDKNFHTSVEIVA